MGVPMNAEGYPDKASRFGYRPLIYVCSPFSGDVEGNTKRARRYSRYAVDQGCIPIAPHLLLPQYMEEETEQELAMFMDLVILDRCRELWVFGSNVTGGMQREIARAKQKEMKVRYIAEEEVCTKQEKASIWSMMWQ